MNTYREQSPSQATPINRIFGDPYQAPSSKEVEPPSASIVVPLDGSRVAEHALPLALAIAQRSKRRVRLAYLRNSSHMNCSPQWLLGAAKRSLESCGTQERPKYLEGLWQRVHQNLSRRTLVEVTEAGDIADVCNEARSGDLVVLAASRKSWWDRALAGRMVKKNAERLNCPLLLVPGYNSPVDLSNAPVPAEIIVPLDGTRSAERVLPNAAAMAMVCQSRLTLLHVHTDYLSCDREDQVFYLNRTAKLLLAESVSVRTLVVDSAGESVAKVIAAVVNSVKGGMPALAGRPSGSLLQLLEPNVVDWMITRFSGPVMFQPSER